jgi:hypothetical protein
MILDKISLIDQLTSATFRTYLRDLGLTFRLEKSDVSYEISAYKNLRESILSTLEDYTRNESSLTLRERHNPRMEVQRMKHFIPNLNLLIETYEHIISHYLEVKGLSELPFNMKRYIMLKELIEMHSKNSTETKDLAKDILKDILNPLSNTKVTKTEKIALRAKELSNLNRLNIIKRSSKK